MIKFINVFYELLILKSLTKYLLSFEIEFLLDENWDFRGAFRGFANSLPHA